MNLKNGLTKFMVQKYNKNYSSDENYTKVYYNKINYDNSEFM